MGMMIGPRFDTGADKGNHLPYEKEDLPGDLVGRRERPLAREGGEALRIRKRVAKKE